jgi:glutamate dehydrogenase
VRFLNWLAANHFTFLGYRQYTSVTRPGETVLVHPVTGHRLGAAALRQRRIDGLRSTHPEARRGLATSELLIITKANSRATVHRPVYLDYVGIKTFDAQGEVTGEHRFLGLFAARHTPASIMDIPILGDRAREVLDRVGFSSDSHSGKDLLQVLESYPRDELFQTDATSWSRSPNPSCTCRSGCAPGCSCAGTYGRFMSAIVYLPRDRYNTAVRLRMEACCATAFGAESVDYTTRVTESPLAQVHFVMRVPKGAPLRRSTPPRSSARSSMPPAPGTRTCRSRPGRARRGSRRAAAGLYVQGLPRGLQRGLRRARGVTDIKRIEALATPTSRRTQPLPRARTGPATSAASSSTRARPALAHRSAAGLHPHGPRGHRRAPLRAAPADGVALGCTSTTSGCEPARRALWGEGA